MVSRLSSRSPCRQHRLERSRCLDDFVRLDDVPDMNVVEVLDPNAAFHTRTYILHVVLETPQGGDFRPFSYDHPIASDLDQLIAYQRPCGHNGPRNDATFAAQTEDLSNFGGRPVLDRLERRQEPLEAFVISSHTS